MMAVESAPTPAHIVIDDPENGSLFHETAQFRSRVTSLANSYLQGRPLFIQTASLRGPFDPSWKSPWYCQAKKRKVSMSKPSTHHVQPQYYDLQTAKSKGNILDDSYKRRVSHDKHQRRNTLGLHVTFDEPTNSSREVNRSEPRGSRPMQNRREQSGERTKGATAERPLETSGLRKLSSAEQEKDFGQTDSELGELEILGGYAAQSCNSDRASSAQYARANQQDDTDNNIRDQALAHAPVRVRHPRNVYTESLSKKTCTWCGTDASHQWRRGPQGPGTLCSSCGSKWTHQQKKKAQQDDHPVKAASANSTADHNHTRNASKRRDIPAKPQDRNKATRRLSHQQICAKMFPDADVCDAVLGNHASRLEQLLIAEVLNLRGEPSPSMREWDSTATPERSAHESSRILKPSYGTSPGRRKISSAPQCITEASSEMIAPSHAASRKRRVINFDTPRPLTSGRPSKEDMATEVASRVIEKSTPVKADKEMMKLSEPEAQMEHSVAIDNKVTGFGGEKTPAKNGIQQAGTVDQKLAAQQEPASVRRRSSASLRYSQMSTQAMLMQAQRALQDPMHTFADSPDKLSAAATHLTTPPTINTPQRSPGRPPSVSTHLQMCTQELFDQTLRFNTPSPAKKSEAFTQHTRLSRLSERETPNSSSLPKQVDLPTSPPTSEPELAISAGQLDSNGPVSERPSPRTPPQAQVRQDTPSSSVRPSPPLFSSATGTIHHTTYPRNASVVRTMSGCSQGVDLDDIIAEAGTFLDSWRT